MMSRKKVLSDASLLSYLAGHNDDVGPVIESLTNSPKDYYECLGEVIADRMGGKYDDFEQSTPADRLNAMRMMISLTIEAEAQANLTSKEAPTDVSP